MPCFILVMCATHISYCVMRKGDLLYALRNMHYFRAPI